MLIKFLVSILDLNLIRIMKHILTHILAVFFLLFFAGNRLLDISSVATTSYATTHITHAHQHTVKAIDHRFTKEGHSDYSSPVVEIDNSDLDLSNQLVFVATLVKWIAVAFVLHFGVTHLRKRRFFYEAYIRLFRQKYLVLHTWRI